MKNFALLILFLGLIQKQTVAQQIGWYWANPAASNFNTFGNGITTDVFGNVYVTGGYGAPTLSLGTTSYTGTGGMYLVKYDAVGNVLWAKTATGVQGSMGTGVSTDSNGNVFFTGGFVGSSLIFGTYTLSSAGLNDLFIIKLDPNGSVIWAKSAGGTQSDYGKSISIDSNGNAIVTGYSQSPTLTIGSSTLSNVGQGVLVVKYDPNGTVLWAKSGVGTTNNFWAGGTSVSADVNGNVLVSGFYRNSSISFGTYSLTNVGSEDLFIVKFDPSGSVLWAKSTGGSLSDVSLGISSDFNGNCFITGCFQSASIGFGTSTLTNSVPQSPYIFVAKYDASGNALWAKGLGLGQGNGISVSSSGSVFATGYFTSASMVFGTSTLTNNGATDFFVAEFDALGNEVASISAGGSLEEDGAAIAADGGGGAFVVGSYKSSPAIFGAKILNNSNTNNSNVFVGRVGICSGPPQPPVDVTPSGNKYVCENLSTVLSVSGTGIINWFASPTSSLPLASGYSFISPGLSLGTYTFYSEAKTCTTSVSRTAITVTVNICSGLRDQVSLNSTLLVYPNPVQEKLSIKNGESSIDKLSIFNCVGEIVLQYRDWNTSQSLDVIVLPAGIYFLKVEYERGQSIIKFIKE
jgi:hypothetical protein